MGASFGYKVAPTNEPYLALALIACQRPVYMRVNMKEHNVRTPKRSPFLMHIKAATDKNGKLVGLDQIYWVDHGPYSESANDLTNKGGQFFFSPYAYENMRAVGYMLEQPSLERRLPRVRSASDILGMQKRLAWTCLQISAALTRLTSVR